MTPPAVASVALFVALPVSCHTRGDRLGGTQVVVLLPVFFALRDWTGVCPSFFAWVPGRLDGEAEKTRPHGALTGLWVGGWHEDVIKPG